jgi:hypothetical protein
VLRRITGRHEWGLRLTWDERAAQQAVRRAQRQASSGGTPSGAAYLSRKSEQLGASRVQLEEARTAATKLFRAMAKEADDSRRRTSTEQAAPGSRLLLDAAFLVPAAEGSAFRRLLRREQKQLEQRGVAVSLTGPWPPYNFI